MTIRRVGLINQSSRTIQLTAIQEVCHALQTQLDRDFTPEVGVRAHVLTFDKGETIPAGIWPMRIVDHPVGGLGIHLDKSHKPYAQIKDTSDWSITASHEMLEMLVDPYGHKFVQAPDIAPSSDGHWHQKLPNGSFVRSKGKVNPKVNPRDDRDAAFGAEDEEGRHDLSRIRAAHLKK